MPAGSSVGLWYLGLLKDAGRPHLPWSLREVDTRLGKNCAYAVLAIQLLTKGYVPQNPAGLWKDVKQAYRTKTQTDPGDWEMAAVKVALALFREGHIHSPQE